MHMVFVMFFSHFKLLCQLVRSCLHEDFYDIGIFDLLDSMSMDGLMNRAHTLAATYTDVREVFLAEAEIIDAKGSIQVDRSVTCRPV